MTGFDPILLRFCRYSADRIETGGILHTPSNEFLTHTIPSLLRGMNGILCTSAISYILNAEMASVQEILTELETAGLICRKREHRTNGWSIPGKNSVDSPENEKWLKRLAEYVLFSPAATLPEKIMVLRNGNPSPRDRTLLLLGVMQQARENGEFRLLASFIKEIMLHAESDLTIQEVENVLAVFEPRKQRYIDSGAAIEFIKHHLPSFTSIPSRAMALARLGELELIENRLSNAEKFLGEALKQCMEGETGEWIPVILSSLGEIPRDFKGMTAMAEEIGRIIDWLPRITDNDTVARILATAASVLAELRKYSPAEKAILSAMSHIPVVTLETQSVLEWCRAKVFIASGRKKAAMSMLQRALLLAQSVNDQLAVMEILNTIIHEMKERPGYSLRSLISIMQSVFRRAESSGNISNRLYTLDQTMDMYTRTLQIREALNSMEKITEILASSEMLSDEPLTSWCSCYIGFLVGRDMTPRSADLHLPGTCAYLSSLAGGIEPSEEAGIVASHLISSPGSDSVVYALILAMEAYARGYDRAASIIAAALDSSYSNSQENPFLSWNLCISGMLASVDRHADDLFQSAQILARQLDRLLLVWLLLRCRMTLSPGRSERENSEISLLLTELDLYIACQLDKAGKRRFMKTTGADLRLEKLKTSSGCASGNLREMRDSIELKLEDESMKSIRDISGISGRISSRSEISASLETIGILAGADRVMALRIKGSTIGIIEGFGPGRWRLPGIEAEDRIREYPDERISIDSFGENPFGSRKYLIIPTEKSVVPAQHARKLYSLSSQRGSYLLIETDTPFENIEKITEFFVDSLCRQVGSALLLRDRESMAYIDTLTGSIIGYSWTRRLLQLTEDAVSCDSPLSVLLIDVDGLREINRIFGYRTGDDTMRIVVSTIKEILRPTDLIGRFREDLFAVMLPDTDGENAMMISQRICGVIAGTEIRPDRVPVTVCIGAAVYSSPEENPDFLINRAYGALSRGKAGGGNRAVLWSADEDVSDSDSGILTVFNTGDPGWDYTVSVTVLELLSFGDGPSLEVVVERLRDALRSEFVYLMDCDGNTFEIGSRILRGIPAEIHESSTGRICSHSGILGRYDALSVTLKCGGRLISAWDNVDGISASLKNVFRALSNLSGLLIQSSAAISGHPPEEHP